MNIVHINNVSLDNKYLYCASRETYDALMQRLEKLSPDIRWSEGQKPTGYTSRRMPAIIEINSQLWVYATGTMKNYHESIGIKRVVL